MEKKNYQDALETVDEGLAYCKSHRIIHYNTHFHYLTGMINYHQKQNEKAREELSKAFDLAEKYGLSSMQVKIQMSIEKLSN